MSTNNRGIEEFIEHQRNEHGIAEPPPGERLPIEKTGCYAIRDEDAIRVYNAENKNLFGLSHRSCAFESKPLFVYLQIYFIGLNTGWQSGKADIKTKISELIKLAL